MDLVIAACVEGYKDAIIGICAQNGTEYSGLCGTYLETPYLVGHSFVTGVHYE